MVTTRPSHERPVGLLAGISHGIVAMFASKPWRGMHELIYLFFSPAYAHWWEHVHGTTHGHKYERMGC